MNCVEAERVRVGAVYRFHCLRHVTVDGRDQVIDWEGSLYRVEEFITDPMGTFASGRTLVLYRGLDGADLGRAYVCTLADFAAKFRPLEEAAEAPVEPPVAVPDNPVPGPSGTRESMRAEPTIIGPKGGVPYDGSWVHK